MVLTRPVAGLNMEEITRHLFKPVHTILYYMKFLIKKIKFYRSEGIWWPWIYSLIEKVPEGKAIVFIPKSLQPNHHLLDDNTYFVGYSLSGRTDPEELPEVWFDGSQLAYISLGTLWNNRKSLFNKFIKAFKDQPWQVAIAYGNNIDKLESELPNVLLKRNLPPLTMLEKADVFITHGGANSFIESIINKTPIVVLPKMGDHFLIAKEVERQKVGIWIKYPHLLTSKKIMGKIKQVADNPQFKENLEKLSKECLSGGGSKRAAEIVLESIKADT